MDDIRQFAPLNAVVYEPGVDMARHLEAFVDTMRARGLRVAGLLQRERPRSGRGKCDMLLEDIATGQWHDITEDRGPLARGCRLNVDALDGAIAAVRASLQSRPDLVVLNKFGKSEASGGGLRDVIADAVSLGIPVVIGVPHVNLAAWREFAGGRAGEEPAGVRELDRFCIALGLR